MKDRLDFLVIGAAKAGTTSLFEHLRRHPEIALPADKEAPFFATDVRYSRGWDRYLKSTFWEADPARRWGTITPQYMGGTVFEPARTAVTAGGGYDEHTLPLRIHERLPEARLIAVLRTRSPAPAPITGWWR